MLKKHRLKKKKSPAEKNEDTITEINAIKITPLSTKVRINIILYGKILKSLSWGFPGGSVVKTLSGNAGDTGLVPGLGRSPAEGNGSSILAWEIPWIEEPGGLQSMGSQESQT